jgi:glycosyltransferase involved in cell wall biosynthesis
LKRNLADQHAFVVLAYKESPFLPGCLHSLTRQTWPSRIVVCTSTPCRYIDDAAAAAGVVVNVNPARQGICADWNFALSKAERRFVTLAHQDDVYFPAFLEQTLDLFEAEPTGAISFTGYREINDLGEPTSSKISRVKHALESLFLGAAPRVHGARLRAFLSFGNPLPCSAVTFDLNKIKGFTFSDRFASNLDWEAWVRLHQQGAVFLHTSDRLVGRRHNALTETHRLIAAGQRRIEDETMFGRLWPKPLAAVLASVYRLGYS